MRRKTLFTTILLLVMAVVGIFVLAGCSENEHEFVNAYDDTYHWKECANCHYAIDHERHMLEYHVTDTQHWQECRACDYISPKTKHHYDNINRCECGKVLVDGVFDMQRLPDGNYEVVNYRGSFSHCIIPRRYQGGDIIKIAERAFASNDSLLSVLLPSSITTIMADAFSGSDVLTIYADMDGEQEGFADNWNSSHRPVVWNYTDNDVASDSYTYYIEDGIKYQLRDGKAKVVKQADDLIGKKIVQSELVYDGKLYVVDSIEDGAFSGCNDIQYVHISDGIKTIGNEAFYGCRSLKGVDIPISVKKIGRNALNGCIALDEIHVDKDNSVYSSEGDCLIDKAEHSVIVGTNSSIIPSGVRHIGEEAFASTVSLESIVIPSTVISIGNNAFGGCRSVMNISVDRGNNVYYSKGNCLIEKIGDKFILGCNNSIIPSGVKIIASDAFLAAHEIKHITVPISVDTIERGAFAGCMNLQQIDIPVTVQHMNEVFVRHPGLTINVEATALPDTWEEMWNPNNYKVVWGYNNITTNADYDYVLHEDKVYLTKNKSSKLDIEVPSQIDGKDVIAIGTIFKHNSDIMTVRLPSNILEIDAYAFSGCELLTIYVEAKSKPEEWGGYWNGTSPIVWDCNNNYIADDGNIYNVHNGIRYALRESNATILRQSKRLSGAYAIPDNITFKNKQYKVTSMVDGAFMGDDDIVGISLPKELNVISKSAFKDCIALKEVNLQEGLVTIDDEAFSGATSLESIFIADTVTYVGNSTFKDCLLLTINAQVAKAPSSWNTAWNVSNCPVNWGYKG